MSGDQNKHKHPHRKGKTVSAKRRRVKGINSTMDDVVTLAGWRVRADIGDAIMDAKLERTIDGASTVTIDVHDPKQVLAMENRLFKERIDIEVDDLQFRTVALTKTDDTLSLTFEDKPVALLRDVTGPRKAFRDQVTRAEFILSQVREARERIPVMIPELRVEQPIKGKQEGGIKWDKERGDKKAAGLDRSAGITVKHVKASSRQLDNIEGVLDTGASMNANAKVMISSIMCITQESNCENLPTGPTGFTGLFQQGARFGWPASNDVHKDAAAYFERAIKSDKQNPGQSKAALVESVQNSGQGSLYAQWEEEATKTYQAYSGGGGGGATGTLTTYKRYAFEREKKENAWDSIGRLADEVRWRRFVASGIFYYMSENDLFQQRPWAVLDESSDGVDRINYNWDYGKKVQEVTVTGRAKDWAAPPGTVVRLRGVGEVADGKYLVTNIQSSFFDDSIQMTLHKPTRKLPEPAPEKVTKQVSTGGDGGSGGSGSSSGKLSSVKINGSSPGAPDWGGAKAVFDQFVDPFMKSKGLSPGSRKRSYNTGSGTSDHWVGSTQAYATDYPTFSGEGAARAIAAAMGYNGWQPNSYTSFGITVDGFRFTVQVLWGAGIDHDDHVHVGMHRA